MKRENVNNSSTQRNGHGGENKKEQSSRGRALGHIANMSERGVNPGNESACILLQFSYNHWAVATFL